MAHPIMAAGNWITPGTQFTWDGKQYLATLIPLQDTLHTWYRSQMEATFRAQMLFREPTVWEQPKHEIMRMIKEHLYEDPSNGC